MTKAPRVSDYPGHILKAIERIDREIIGQAFKDFGTDELLRESRGGSL